MLFHDHKHFSMVSLTRVQENEMPYKSAICLYMTLKFSKLLYLDVLYNIYSGVFQKQIKKSKIKRQKHTFLKSCRNFFLCKNFENP